MKKIIDGKLYNTETAEFVCKSNDYGFYVEYLYVTSKKAWFKTRPYNDGGEIFCSTMREDEVKEIISDDLELYAKYFGEPEEA